MSLSLAFSSVTSAVISFVVEPMLRRLSACRSQATMPVETSITIAERAPTLSGHLRASAGAVLVNIASAAATAASAAAAGRLTLRA